MYVQVSRTHAHTHTRTCLFSPVLAQVSTQARHSRVAAAKLLVELCGSVCVCVCVCVCVFSYLVARHASVEVVNVMVLDTSREEFEDLLCT
jgi:hypothetical protein